MCDSTANLLGLKTVSEHSEVKKFNIINDHKQTPKNLILT